MAAMIRRTVRALRARGGKLALQATERLLHRTVIALDYPPSSRANPHPKQPHPLLEQVIAASRPRYEDTLATIERYLGEMAVIAVHDPSGIEPAWINGYLPGLDAAAIYSLLRARGPRRYVEVGSGNSTKFAARAKRDGGLDVRITSIDPQPRAEIDEICDELLRAPLETLELGRWRSLQSGDIVFLDGSHRVFPNSDVVSFFLDALPYLASGVLVGIHDVYLPFDYPASIADQYYSEQYMLAAWLLGGAPVDIVLPAYWAWQRMRAEVERMWSHHARFAHIERHGGAFWIET